MIGSRTPPLSATPPAALAHTAVIALITVTAVFALIAGGCGGEPDRSGPRQQVIVLGFDGLDYNLTRLMMAEGRLPNFSRLAGQGSFSSLRTAVPPQSPVAWSNFITGMDSGGHGIYDFIHRDPKTMTPYLSTSRTIQAGKTLKLGRWQIPLSGGRVELLRRGKPFWATLEAQGIETTIIRIPANFPPSGEATRELSGMGTPDLTGSPGTFSFYSTDISRFSGERITGGKVYQVYDFDGVVEGKLYGPDNPFLTKAEKATASFRAYIDPVDPAIKLVIGGEERILQEGEWTEWLPIDFKLIPTQKIRGIARFYLKQVRPEFQLYATPINMDPLRPAMPISTPASYAADLARVSGRYYTQGMPEDTKTLSHHVFTPAEFLAQARLAGEENIAQYKTVLDQFDGGLLFYYFGNVDQVAHMMWRRMDPSHPHYDAEADAGFEDVIPNLYERMDAVTGYTLAHMDPSATLIIMSDHGFTSWRRAFNLNTWLKENGYLALRDPNLRDDPGWLSNVDWRNTRAYGLGLNGLYINLRGRERYGIVYPNERQALMDEIAWKLKKVIDPATGEPAVTKVYLREEVYTSRGMLEIGPDIVVGYAKMTRCSNESATGEIPPELFFDNEDEWSGDHCMDDESVPGILLTNRPLKASATSLKNLSAAILAEFGVERPASEN